MKPRDLDAELAPVAGLRQRNVPDMELDVEIRILDPVRMVEVHRHMDDALPERPREMQPRLVILENAFESEMAALDGRLVVDRQPADMHWCVRRLEIEKRRIHRTKLVHVPSSREARRLYAGWPLEARAFQFMS